MRLTYKTNKLYNLCELVSNNKNVWKSGWSKIAS